MQNRRKKEKEDKLGLLIEAYQGVLLQKRISEGKVLNKQRRIKYEKNRPPQKGWHELKDTTFKDELYRNRVSLKPNNSNKEFLTRLQDPCIY